ncbi:TolC family protein [Flammeovirga yaeyamensis]|uniref:TolC family protein n=1 Tax=Flammeovirga yaeyamensis TaxID=367791 RepID=A0AAX1MYK5_9BACT|nr:TolC family protein [Flammeovirga yaeyamensis]MBB3696068.1 outer membrane protein TolC [Flammeovirga yaeyamensis]NMF34753.1 TolC family protein [Flammeovirga yaeyamensis]QWG00419.1 TolC family protein [Flammeovirga yaeyamensis]
MRAHINIYLFLMVCLLSLNVTAQTIITFEQAEQEAIEKHPVNEQQKIYEKMLMTEKEGLNKDRLPDISLQGKVGYFSDVIAPVDPLVGQTQIFPDIPKTQWNTYVNVDYAIYDGSIKTKKTTQKENEYALKIQENEVKKFNIKEKVSNIYFSALNYQEQEQLLQEGVIKEIENQLKEVEALENEGAVLPSVTDGLRVEYYKAQQKLYSVRAQKNGALKALCVWLEREGEWQNITLQRPLIGQSSDEIFRPELQMYNLQLKQTESTTDLLQAKRLPKIYAYGIGGFGTPNPYNFFEVNGDFYYQVGIRFAWTPFDFGKNKKERQVVEIQKEVINTEKETFYKTIASQIAQVEGNKEQLEQLITQDEEIIKLQEKNLVRAKGKLDNGAATSSQYVSALNQLTDAKLNLSSHELQLLHINYQLAMIKGQL